MGLNEINIIVTASLSILSFIITLISIVTVIITIKQNKRLLEANESQLREMREEHQLSVQPIIILMDEKFCIERPRLFYTPPKDSYEFLSRYNYQTTIKNVSTATAICIDLTAELVVQRNERELVLRTTTTKRCNILPYDGESSKIYFTFSGDYKTYFYEALREASADKLPKITIKMTYKNTCGGYFTCQQTSILVPNDEDLGLLQTWHSNIISASVKEKEAFDTMKTIQHDEKWERLFDETKEALDLPLGKSEISELQIRILNIPEKYEFYSISKEEYEKISSDYRYSHFVHKAPNCIPKDVKKLQINN